MKKQFAAIILGTIILTLFPSKTFAATIHLTPSSGKLSVGDEFTVTVLADSDGQTVNVVESNITYSTNTLELLGVTQGSTFVLATPASPNQGQGTAYFGGGLPNPGFAGSNGILGIMKFRAKSVGNAKVSISRGRALLNDGQGTEAPIITQDANFTITLPATSSVQVFSADHPNQSDWSKNNDLNFNWIMPTGAYGVSFALDQKMDTVPDDVLDATNETQTMYPKLKDGIWYFHIKARNKSPNDPFGPVTHYKVQIDIVAPLPFKINLVAENDLKEVSITPTINYSAIDATSGAWRYDVYMDNHLIKEISEPPFSYEKQTVGDHVIKVVAYDRAGNGTESELPITITAGPVPTPLSLDYFKKYLQIPLYGFVAVNLIVLSMLAYVVIGQRKQKETAQTQAVAMAQIQSDISSVSKFDVQLTQLKRQIDVRFSDAAKNQHIQMDALRTDITHKIETEIEKNVMKLKYEIDARINQMANTPGQMQFMRNQVQKNIISEIQESEHLAATDKEAADKVEVLRRLHDEFMYNKVT